MDWTLRKKILVGYGLVLALLLLVFGWAFLNLTWLGGASDAMLSENYESIRAADAMIGAVERQESGLLLFWNDFEDEGAEQFWENQAEFQQWLARAENNITIEGEREIIDRIDTAYAEYTTRFANILRDDLSAEDAYHDQMKPTFQEVRAACEELRMINLETMQAQSEETQALASRAIWSVGGVGLLAVVLGLAFSALLSKRIVRPIRQLKAASKALAEGDYEARVDVESQDELGGLAEQFNAMADHLQSYQALNVERLIAEKRKNEAIIQSMADGVLIIGADQTVETANPIAEDVLGTNAQAMQGRPFHEVLDHELLRSEIEESIEEGRLVGNEESHAQSDERVIERSINGDTRHYEYAITPIFESPDERDGGVVVVFRDVTHFKEVERLKSEFVATASHQLKTPLTSIAMSIRLLMESDESSFSDDDYELLESAQEDTVRLRNLTQDLLDLSKIESGKMELDLQAVSASLMFDKTEQALGPQADEQDVELITDAPEDMPPLQADATKITWVLTNLVSNALRYTDPGGTIELSADVVGNKAHLSVSDDGAGIPHEHQAKIFDKFVQVDGGGTSGGSGLGLAISREVVQAHGGAIWVDSTPGEGSTFTFTVPLAGSGDGALRTT